MSNGKEEQLTQRRREILEAARRTFNASGYGSTTMDAVAAAAGVAKGSLYNYFPSKQELFKQLFLEDLTIQDYQAMLASRGTASQKLERMLDLWFAQMEKHRESSHLVLEYWATAAREGREGEMAAMFQRVYQQWHDLVSNVVAEGIAAGEFASRVNPSMSASLIIALVDGVNTQAMMNIGLVVDAELLRWIKRAILAWLTMGRSENVESEL